MEIENKGKSQRKYEFSRLIKVWFQISEEEESLFNEVQGMDWLTSMGKEHGEPAYLLYHVR